MHAAWLPEEPCAFRNPEASLSFLMIWRGTTGAAGDSAACSLHLRLRGGGPVIGSSTDAGGGPCSMLPLVFEPRKNRVRSGGSGHGTKALRVAADGHRGSSERRGRNGRRGLQRVQERTCLFDGCHAVRSLHIGGLGAQVSHTARRMLCIWGPSERTEVG